MVIAIICYTLLWLVAAVLSITTDYSLFECFVLLALGALYMETIKNSKEVKTDDE